MTHADYIESWLRVLRKNKRAIFMAASQASKAHDCADSGSDA
jgi:antirestriction protein ArdC